MKIIYLILATENEPFTTHMKAQQDTWVKGIEKDKIFYILGSKFDKPHHDSEKLLLHLPVEERYGNILEKTLLAMRWALENVEFDFLVRGNTSTYYNERELRKIIEKEAGTTPFLGGEFGFIKFPDSTKETLDQFVAGTAIVLSHQSTKKLVQMKVETYDGWEDDPAISHFLLADDCHMTHIHRNDLTDFKPFINAFQHRVKSWSNSDFVAKRMYEIDAIYSQKGIKRHYYRLKHGFSEMYRFRQEYPISEGLNILRLIRFISKSCSAFFLFEILRVPTKRFTTKNAY